MGIGMLIGTTDGLCPSYCDKEMAPDLGGMEFPLDPTLPAQSLKFCFPTPLKAGLAAFLPAGSH